MSETLSNMLPLGTPAPDFSLPDTISGKMVSLNDVVRPSGTVVMFICNHCPYVILVLPELLKLAKEYQEKGIGFVAISANDVENYPQDSSDLMKALAQKEGFTFPYLYDESQDIAKAYDAACTPDFYVFDGDVRLYYRGRMDNATPGNGHPVTGKDLREALDALLQHKKAPADQWPSMGCNIKWKK
ncbi:MAG TPA: thioredoxin family protein [Saprospiraceae bacterium]|nr:thioredoxin family protein [Saprospiraceae bacterium]